MAYTQEKCYDVGARDWSNLRRLAYAFMTTVDTMADARPPAASMM